MTHRLDKKYNLTKKNKTQKPCAYFMTYEHILLQAAHPCMLQVQNGPFRIKQHVSLYVRCI